MKPKNHAYGFWGQRGTRRMENELNYVTTVLEVHILLTVYIPFKFHVGNLSNSYVKFDKIKVV